jgi:hypothetical protein
MNRYSITDIIKDLTGKRRLSTTILPIVPFSDADVYIRTTSRERLDKLAYKFYGVESYWWIIAASNSLGKGSLYVPKNTKLRIPSADAIGNFINDINAER